MSIEALASVAAQEVAAIGAKEAAMNAASEIAQKMAAEAGSRTTGSELQNAIMERQAMQEEFRLGEMPENNGESRETLKQLEADAAEELRGKLDAERTQPLEIDERGNMQNSHGPETRDLRNDQDSPEATDNAEQINTVEMADRTESQDISKGIPKNDGHWEGDPGDSKWIPDGDYVPLKHNPEAKSWKDILRREGIDGIEFKNGEPDFSPVSKGTVEIEDFRPARDGKNFAQADIKLSEQWNASKKDGRTDWKPRDVQAYRQENHLTWHERSDMKTMDLVPTDVHANVWHTGGISVAKHTPGASEYIKQPMTA